MLSMLSLRGHVDHRVALWIEGDHADMRPVARLTRPARRVALLGLDVQRMPSRQDGLVTAGVALLRADVADATVAMIDVVPSRPCNIPETRMNTGLESD